MNEEGITIQGRHRTWHHMLHIAHRGMVHVLCTAKVVTMARDISSHPLGSRSREPALGAECSCTPKPFKRPLQDDNDGRDITNRLKHLPY